MSSLPESSSVLRTAGLAAALAFVAAESSASVVYNDVPDVITNSAVGFNPVTGASVAGFSSAITVSFACGGLIYGQFYNACVSSMSSVGFLATPVTAGTVIDGSASWADSTSGFVRSLNGFTPTVRSFVPFRFKTSAQPSVFLYGWAEISTSYGGIPGNTMNLYSYAYENTGAPITAGAIPEPATFATLAGFSALALVGFRRASRRKSV